MWCSLNGPHFFFICVFLHLFFLHLWFFFDKICSSFVGFSSFVVFLHIMVFLHIIFSSFVFFSSFVVVTNTLQNDGFPFVRPQMVFDDCTSSTNVKGSITKLKNMSEGHLILWIAAKNVLINSIKV